jgi:E3 ubiquitin-protein ligase DOA10
MQCRYCLSDELVGETDEFVDPCNCQGSLKYVHQMCLYQWISKSGKQSDLVLVEKNNKLENFKLGSENSSLAPEDNSVYLYCIKCEICRYQMKCYQIYQLSIFMSLLNTIKSFLLDLKKYPFMIFHFSVLYFLYSQFQSLTYCIFEIFYMQIGRKIFMNFINDISLFMVNFWFAGRIIKFYKNKFIEQRGTVIKFLPKSRINCHS